VPAGQRPGAVVDPQLFDSSVGPSVDRDRDGEIHPPVRTAEVEDHLANATALGP
jgi:hypothetical protein